MTRIEHQAIDHAKSPHRAGRRRRLGGLGLAAAALAAALCIPTMGGCASKAQTGALIGAGAGAAGGYIIGNEMDKQDLRDHHH